jgi:hypothetical protein
MNSNCDKVRFQRISFFDQCIRHFLSEYIASVIAGAASVTTILLLSLMMLFSDTLMPLFFFIELEYVDKISVTERTGFVDFRLGP